MNPGIKNFVFPKQQIKGTDIKSQDVKKCVECGQPVGKLYQTQCSRNPVHTVCINCRGLRSLPYVCSICKNIEQNQKDWAKNSLEKNISTAESLYQNQKYILANNLMRNIFCEIFGDETEADEVEVDETEADETFSKLEKTNIAPPVLVEEELLPIETNDITKVAKEVVNILEEQGIAITPSTTEQIAKTLKSVLN